MTARPGSPATPGGATSAAATSTTSAPTATRTQLLLAAGAMCGIQVCYSCQINHGSSTLLALGLDETRLSLAWLAGPLSGLIVQPIVGVASDACTSPLGKRRPFLIAGATFTSVALLLFSNARPVASLFVDSAETAASTRLALSIAIFSFFLLDFAIQAIQAPLRALITDIASGDLLPVGNVYIALFTGLGNLLGSLLASRKLSETLPFFANDTQALFAIATFTLILSVTLCVVNVVEVPLSRNPSPPTFPSSSSPVTTAAAAAPASSPRTRTNTLRADAIDAALASPPAQAGAARTPPLYTRASSTGDFGATERQATIRVPPAALPRSVATASAATASATPSASLDGNAPQTSFFRVSSSPSMWSLGMDDFSPSMQRLARGGDRFRGSRSALLADMARSRSRASLSCSDSPWFVSLLRDAPRPFWRVFIVQLFTWFGFFSLFVFVNAWVGTNVYLGQGTAPEGSILRERFEDGVRLGGVGNALTALVTVMYSPVITSLLERYGVLKTYAFSQLVEATCLISAHFIRGTPEQARPSPLLKLAAVVDIGAFGIVWATTMGVPWAIIGKALNDDPAYRSRIGLFTTVFNISQSFPQLFVSFGSPYILALYDNDVSSVMFVGGVLALVGAVLVFVLRVDVFSEGEEEGYNEVIDSDDTGGAESVASRSLSNIMPPLAVASRPKRDFDVERGVSGTQAGASPGPMLNPPRKQ